MKSLHRLHAGFAAIAGLFLLVVLAALGAFMLTISNTQQIDSAQDLQGSRAYWAARAGLSWGVGSVVASSAACPTPPAPFVVDGFTLNVTCSRQTYSEGSGTVVVFTFFSVATSAAAVGSLGRVERSVALTLEM